MTRRPLGGRSLTVASLPLACAVCGGARSVRLVALAGMRGAGSVACPHCSGGAHGPIPILILPMHDDTPKDVA